MNETDERLQDDDMGDEGFGFRVINGELAVPGIASEAWCYPECYLRWMRLDRATQGVLGGHIHYQDGRWSVPFRMPLVRVGRIADGRPILDCWMPS